MTTTGDQGSGMLRSMVRANGLIVIPEDQEIAREGEKVRVQLLDGVFAGFKGFRVEDSSDTK